MSRFTLLRAGCLAWCGAALVLAAPPAVTVDTLDDAIVALMAKRKVPGLSLAVIQDGAIVKAKGYGVADLGTKAPVTPDTLFQAGSVSKPVAAMGALLLVDRQKLALDANVNEALKSWQLRENVLMRGHPVTLRQLLSHTAGMGVHGFPGYAAEAPLPTLIQVLNGKPPANTPAIRVENPPGEEWRYSGGGYTVAQQMMIDAAGQPFPEFMRENVLEPLGMKASSFDQPLAAARAALTASGYLPGGRAVPGRWHVYPEMAAAGLWTTPSDLARFALALQRSFAGEKHPVLAGDTARLMVTRVKNGYGLGLGMLGREGGEFEKFTHNGRDEGFDALLWAYRAKGLGAVLMINTNDNANVLGHVLDAIAAAYRWPNHPFIAPPKPIEDKEPAVAELVREIFIDAQAGKFRRELFTAELADKLEPIASTVAKDFVALGPLKTIALVERQETNGRRIYRYHLVCEQDESIAFCAFNPAGKIEGISFSPP